MSNTVKLVLRSRFVTSMQRVTLFVSNLILELNHSGNSRDEGGAPNREKVARASMGFLRCSGRQMLHIFSFISRIL